MRVLIIRIEFFECVNVNPFCVMEESVAQKGFQIDINAIILREVSKSKPDIFGIA